MKFTARIVGYIASMIYPMYKITLNVDIDSIISGMMTILILNSTTILLDYAATRNQYIDEVLYFQAIKCAKDKNTK